MSKKSTTDQDRQQIFKKGETFYQQGNYAEALKCFHQVLAELDSAPDESKNNVLKRSYNYSISSCYLQLKNYAEAVKFSNEAVRLNELCRNPLPKYKDRLLECQKKRAEQEAQSISLLQTPKKIDTQTSTKDEDSKPTVPMTPERSGVSSLLTELSIEDIKSLSQLEYFTAYVPQGRSGRLHSATKAHKVTGLYTNNFSSCNIIIGVGKEKITLIHADQAAISNFVQIKQELAWVGSPDEITTIILFREQGKILTKMCIKEINKKNLKLIPVPAQCDGVYVSLDVQKESPTRKHEHVTLYETHYTFPGLIHHPREQEFLAVRKIEQIIGMEALKKTGTCKEKYLNIFDGRSWEPLHPNEYKIDSSHPLTQKELKKFKPTDNVLDMYDNLYKIIKSSGQFMSSTGQLESEAKTPSEDIHFYQDIVFHIEGYLNVFNAELIFKKNLRDLLDPSKRGNIYQVEKYPTESDKKSCIKLLNLTKISEQNIESIFNQVGEYQKDITKTAFKEYFFKQYKDFHTEYCNRNRYRELKILQKEKIDQALTKYKKAEELFLAKKYPSAANLFMEFICECSPFCIKDWSEFRKAHFKCGVSLLNNKDYEGAESFLSSSKNLLLFVQHPDKREKEQIEYALKQLETAIKGDTEVSLLSFS